MKNRKERDISEIIWDTVKWVCILLFTVVCIYPFYYVLINSVSSTSATQEGIYLLPKGFNLEIYRQVLQRGDIGLAFVVSVARTVVGTSLCVLFTSMLAFLMTRKEMPGRKIIYRFIIITMYFNAGLVSWYLVMKAYHLHNSFLLYVIPGAINAYYMILIKTFIEQLPDSLSESAAIEGAGRWSIFFRIVMPLSKPILATIAVYAAVGNWNSWQDNFLMVNDKKLQTVQLVLYNYINSAAAVANALKTGGTNSSAMAEAMAKRISPMNVRMAALMITVVPIMLVYPFAQKYFAKGIMMGAVKG